jgi:hypothetical protein
MNKAVDGTQLHMLVRQLVGLFHEMSQYGVHEVQVEDTKWRIDARYWLAHIRIEIEDRESDPERRHFTLRIMNSGGDWNQSHSQYPIALHMSATKFSGAALDEFRSKLGFFATPRRKFDFLEIRIIAEKYHTGGDAFTSIAKILEIVHDRVPR